MMRSLTLRRQRGAALLMAMLIVTLVTTLAAGMVWQQWRAIEVEGAERARSQASWLIEGTTDWARLILREDSRGSGGKANVDSPDENWGIPLRDVKLSDFLAADKNNVADSSGVEALLSGQITDAQGRFNLRNLVADDEEAAAVQVRAFKRLCDALGLPGDTALKVAEGMNGANAEQDGGSAATPDTPLPPHRIEQLAWLGLDPEAIKRLAPFVVLLPTAAPVNVNSASPEVLVAVIEGLDRGSADRLLRARPAGGYESIDAIQKQLPEKIKLNQQQVSVASTHFEIDGELRYDQYVLRERSLVQRRGLEVTVLRRERLPPE